MTFNDALWSIVGFVIFFGFLIFVLDSGSDEPPSRLQQYGSQQAYDSYEQSAQDDQYWQTIGR